MRYALAAILALAACSVDPVPLPDAATPDAGPCGGACGPGTVCVGGACVVVDAGARDVPPVDSGGVADVVDGGGVEVGASDDVADAGFDAGAVDALPVGCVSTTPGNCCGVACPSPAHGTAACGGGQCGVASCEAGYINCGTLEQGCNIMPMGDVANCGGCRHRCADGQRCLGGVCR